MFSRASRVVPAELRGMDPHIARRPRVAAMVFHSLAGKTIPKIFLVFVLLRRGKRIDIHTMSCSGRAF
jgi:hypothetical protein